MNGGPEEGTWLSKVRDYGNGPLALVHQVESDKIEYEATRQSFMVATRSGYSLLSPSLPFSPLI